MADSFDSLFSGTQSDDSSFGSDIDFGNGSDSFGSDINFDGGSDSFDGGSDSFGNGSDSFGNGSFNNQNSFDNTTSSFNDSNNNEFQEDDTDRKITGKAAIIIAAVGVVLVIIIVIIATAILNRHKGDTVKESNDLFIEESSDENTQDVNSNKHKESAESVMREGNENNTDAEQKTTVINTNDGQFTWTEIGDNEDVEWNEEYSTVEFTITGIKHYARSVDVNNNLVIKTTLTGSLAGFPGSYTLDIPYSKGTRVSLGDNFNVNVQIGNYNGKTVVGEVSYK